MNVLKAAMEVVSLMIQDRKSEDDSGIKCRFVPGLIDASPIECTSEICGCSAHRESLAINMPFSVK
jgi:hypothetical protein